MLEIVETDEKNVRLAFPEIWDGTAEVKLTSPGCAELETNRQRSVAICDVGQSDEVEAVSDPRAWKFAKRAPLDL